MHREMPRAALKLIRFNPYNATRFIIVHTLPYTMKFDGEHPILKAIVGVSHSIQPSVGRKLMKNTGNTLGNL